MITRQNGPDPRSFDAICDYRHGRMTIAIEAVDPRYTVRHDMLRNLGPAFERNTCALTRRTNTRCMRLQIAPHLISDRSLVSHGDQQRYALLAYTSCGTKLRSLDDSTLVSINVNFMTLGSSGIALSVQFRPRSCATRLRCAALFASATITVFDLLT
jgi:hypothetical protein